MFDEIVNETNNPLQKFIFSEKITSIDGVEEWYYKSNNVSNILTFANKSVLGALSAYDDGQIFYFADEDIFEVLNKATGSYKY